MTKQSYNIVRWVIAVACAVPVYGQENQSLVRWDLKDKIRHGPPETLSVYVEVVPVQPDVEQGIVFTLNIENNSSKAIQILDPVDMMKVRLFRLGYAGAVNLRNTKPDYTTCWVNSFSDEQLKKKHDNKVARRPFLAFDSEDALRNRHMKTVSDIVPHKLERNIERNAVPKSKNEQFQTIPEGKLTLEAGEHFQAVLQIRQIIFNPVAPAITKTGNLTTFSDPREYDPQIVDTIPDMYSLRLYCTLWTDIEGAETWIALSERIAIQLGEPDSQEQ